MDEDHLRSQVPLQYQHELQWSLGVNARVLKMAHFRALAEASILAEQLRSASFVFPMELSRASRIINQSQQNDHSVILPLPRKFIQVLICLLLAIRMERGVRLPELYIKVFSECASGQILISSSPAKLILMISYHYFLEN